jgi:hypothetical protein
VLFGDIGSYQAFGRRGDSPTPAPHDFGNRSRPILVIKAPLVWPHFKALATRFRATSTSHPNQLGQAFFLLIFLRSKSLLNPAKPPIDSLHRLLCLFGDGGAGRSTLSDMELVTTFSAETNWSSITNGSLGMLVGMMLVSNRSNRRDRSC